MNGSRASAAAISAVSTTTTISSGEVNDKRSFHFNDFKVQKEVNAMCAIEATCTFASCCTIRARSDGGRAMFSITARFTIYAPSIDYTMTAKNGHLRTYEVFTF